MIALRQKKNILLKAFIISVMVFIGYFFILFPISALALDAPAHTKTLTPNGDGTYKLSLSVTGKSQASVEKPRANVVVVFDKSNSMDKMSFGQSRLSVAQEAVNSLIDELMSSNSSDDPNRVQMSLVTFDSTANKIDFGGSNWTSDSSDFKNVINNITTPGSLGYEMPYGGTNWEDAIKAALEIAQNGDGDPTYIVFISDGNPTFYNGTSARYDYYASQKYIRGTGYDYGWGSENNVQASYNAAIDDARAVVSQGNTLYAVGTFGDVNRMQSFVEYAYNSPAGDHYYSAADKAGLNRAFAAIVADIKHQTFYTNVSIKDGLTDMASAVDINGNSTSFTYTKTDKNGVVSEWNDAPEAKIEGDTVVWDLSSVGQLESDVTYTVSFTVTPTQKALNSVADAANGKEKDQNIVDNGDGTYSVYSNTSATVDFTQRKTVNGVVTSEEQGTAPYERPTMKVPVSKVKIEKKWIGDNLSDHADKVVTVQVKKTVTVNGSQTVENYGDPITLDASNDWTKSIAVPGSLDGDTTWSVDEISSIEGYDTSYSSPVVYNSYRSGNFNGNVDGINTITNTLRTYDLIIYKTASNDANIKTPLSGAEFTVFAEDGQTVVAAAAATESNGKVTFSNLRPGTYVIRETKVPAGYQKLGNDMKLVITASGDITLDGRPISADHQGVDSTTGHWFQIDVDNYVLSNLPSTDGMGITPFISLGVMFLLLAVICVVFYLNKKSVIESK